MNIKDIKKVQSLIAERKQLHMGLSCLKKSEFNLKLNINGAGYVRFSPAIKIILITDYEAAIEKIDGELQELNVFVDDDTTESVK